MDEYVGGSCVYYATSDPLLNRSVELLDNLKCDAENLVAENLRQLQPALELKHRIVTAEAVARHTLFSEETRWPGYYYRADHPKLDDDNWHMFTGSKYNARENDLVRICVILAPVGIKRPYAESVLHGAYQFFPCLHRRTSAGRYASRRRRPRSPPSP